MADCCSNPKIATIMGKCSDLCSIRMKNIKYNGYVPYNIGIGGGDYLNLTVCLTCGKLQDFKAPDLEDFINDNKKDNK